MAVGALVAAVGSLWLVARAEDARAAGGPPPRAGSAAPAVVATLAAIPSHDRIYSATMIPSPGPVERNRPLAWTVEVRTAAGAPVEGAALVLESWMPDEERVAAAHPRATAYLGGGRCRVEGLRFDRRGWWNVKLAISAAGVTDSLAFNLVL